MPADNPAGGKFASLVRRTTGAPAGRARKSIGWAACLGLLIGLSILHPLCAAPHYYYVLALLGLVPIILGDVLVRAVGVFALLVILTLGMQQPRSSCTPPAATFEPRA